MTSSPVTDTPKTLQAIKFSKNGSHQLVKWRVREGDQMELGTVLFEYQAGTKQKISKFTSFNVGVLQKILIQVGDTLTSNSVVCEFEKNCDHPEVVCGMCTHCGEAATAQEASVPIVIGIPQIRVSKQQAEELAKDDKLRLLRQKKLALIIDLDQTLVHTSTDVNIRKGLPDVYGFRLNNYPHRYHARLRPHVHELLDKLSPLYELYIFTMGTHCYAHTLSKILDPQRKLFSQRIISRDECFDSRSKLPTIRSVFPCGDEMVAIIDDREDMWARCPNLVHVKPYIFFGSTGDIHAPERMSHQLPQEGAQHMPSHFTPPIITPPPVMSHLKIDIDPPTESDSGDVATDSNFASVTFHTDPVAPVSDPLPISEDSVMLLAPVSDPLLIPEESIMLVAPVSEPLPISEESIMLLAPVSEPLPISEESIMLLAPVSEPLPISEESIMLLAPVSEPLPISEESIMLLAPVSDPLLIPDESIMLVAPVSDPLPISDESIMLLAPVSDPLPISEESVPPVSDPLPISEDSVMHVAPVSDPPLPISEDSVMHVAPVSDPPLPIPEESVLPVAPVSEQENRPEAGDDTPTPSDSCENSGYNEQLIPPLSSSSEPSDTSEDSNSGSDSSSSQPPEGKIETESGPDAQAAPSPPPPQTAPPENETRKDVTEISDPDKFLLYLITTLTKIHSMFYDRYTKIQAEYELVSTREQKLVTPDLKEIIPRLRHSVLKGAYLVFTGVIPTNRNPQDDPLWNTARAFGAVIHERIHIRQEGDSRQSNTTHVIATKPGTNKYREAIRVPGIRIVTPEWLWACAETWQWIDEKDFPVRVRRESKDKLGQLHKKPHLSVEGADEEDRDIDYPPFLESEFTDAPTSSQPMDTIELHLDIDLSKVSDEGERVFTPERISFSLEDINAMNEEVNLACDCTSSSNSSSNELQDYPEGFSRKRKRPVKSEPTTDNTTDTGSSTDREEVGGSFDTMAAQLEREFEADKV